MQAIVRRAVRHRARADKKLDKIKQLDSRLERDSIKENQKQFQKEVRNRNRNARFRYKRDWILGDMAPKRHFDERWGTVSQTFTLPPKVLPVEYKPGKSYIMNKFLKGDRVVIVNGLNKGQIVRIDSVDKDTKTAKLKDMNMAYVRYAERYQLFFPEVTFEKEGSLEAIPISWDDIRLVHRLGDKDVIVDRMLVTFNKGIKIESGEARKAYVMKDNCVRRIPGTYEDLNNPKNSMTLQEELAKLKISMPSNAELDQLAGTSEEAENESEEKEEEETEEKETHPIDTLPQAAETQSWEPSLAEAPMPPGVIDELRNKFSKFRTRHDDEFVAKMLALDEKQEIRKKASQLVLNTPTKQIHQIQREAVREAAKKQQLNEDSLALLGQYMAQHLKLKSAANHTPIEGIPVQTSNPSEARPL